MNKQLYKITFRFDGTVTLAAGADYNCLRRTVTTYLATDDPMKVYGRYADSVGVSIERLGQVEVLDKT